MVYLELAEQGIAVAQLNVAILLDNYDIFDNDKVFLTDIARANGDKNFNINKHLAFKYFSLAAL